MMDSCETNAQEDRINAFSTTEITVTESSNAEEESAQKLTNNSCVIEKTVLWKTFKTFVFLICLIFLIIQSVEFFNIYYTYPTNIVQESTVNIDFKMPAATLCFRNTISTEKFCFENPDLCEKPSNLEEFCKKYSFYCKGNTSMLMIPMMGYYTNYSEEVKEMSQRYLLNGSLDDPNLFWKSGYGSNFSTQNVITFVDDFEGLLKCYSYNLHLYQSALNPEIAEIGSFRRKEGNLILWYSIELHKIELFSPLNKPQVYFGIHSPFVPIDPVTEGHEIRIGYHYQFQVQLEKEEYLLPPPYQTNCRDNGPSDDGEKFTNPNSYQICLEMCSSEFSKEIFGCDYGMTMQLSTNHLCYGDIKRPGISDELESELYQHFLSCTQNCRTECLKLQYKYIMKKREISSFEQRRKTGWSVIDIYVKNAEVTVIRHVPLYGSGELFSHIGGLLGCWLGVSVFTFTDIIGKVFWKAVSWKMDKIQKYPDAEHLD